MSTSDDHSQGQSASSGERAGFSTLDLMNSSPAVNRVVRFMLKRPRMTYQELLDTVAQMPEEKRLTTTQLDEALDTLIQMDWLSRSEEGSQAVYQVVLRPKASSAEQLHSDALPKIEVAVGKVDPGLKPAVKEKKSGLSGLLRALFGGKK